MEKLYIAFVVFMLVVGFIIYWKIQDLKTSLTFNPTMYEKDIFNNN